MPFALLGGCEWKDIIAPNVSTFMLLSRPDGVAIAAFFWICHSNPGSRLRRL
jgi:hypothetical protein